MQVTSLRGVLPTLLGLRSMPFHILQPSLLHRVYSARLIYLLCHVQHLKLLYRWMILPNWLSCLAGSLSMLKLPVAMYAVVYKVLEKKRPFRMLYVGWMELIVLMSMTWYCVLLKNIRLMYNHKLQILENCKVISAETDLPSLGYRFWFMCDWFLHWTLFGAGARAAVKKTRQVTRDAVELPFRIPGPALTKMVICVFCAFALVVSTTRNQLPTTLMSKFRWRFNMEKVLHLNYLCCATNKENMYLQIHQTSWMSLFMGKQRWTWCTLRKIWMFTSSSSSVKVLLRRNRSTARNAEILLLEPS